MTRGACCVKLPGGRPREIARERDKRLLAARVIFKPFLKRNLRKLNPPRIYALPAAAWQGFVSTPYPNSRRDR